MALMQRVPAEVATAAAMSHAPRRPAAGPRVLTVGDNVVDRYVDAGCMYPGGNAVNVAVHTRRNGATSAYLGAVGTDRAGQVVMAALEQEGVDTSLTRQVEGPNAYADVRVVNGNRVFGTGDAGVSRFRLEETELAAASSFDVVHTGECSMVEDQLADLAAASQALSFDFSERPWGYVETHARHVSIAIRSLPVGDRDAAEEEAHRIRDLGPSVVAVTMGAAGALVLADRLAFSPVPPGPVVDTLGAGDAFIARLLVGLVTGEPVGQLVRRATDYATSTCAAYGAFGHGARLTGHPADLEPIRNGRLDLR